MNRVYALISLAMILFFGLWVYLASRLNLPAWILLAVPFCGIWATAAYMVYGYRRFRRMQTERRDPPGR